MKKIVMLVLPLILFSCKKEAAQKSEISAKPPVISKKKPEKMTLEPFAFPAEVAGCSCYFAANREEFIKQNYLYVDEYQKNAFIRINSHQIKIPFDISKIKSPGKNLDIDAENADYSLKIRATQIADGEMETTLYKGTMTVTDKESGQKIVQPIYGECGC